METRGNYLGQEQAKNFPLDAEGLKCIQDNIAAVELIGRLAGNKAIIMGCELSESGNKRNSGWVWLKTRLCPDGELLPFGGGGADEKLYIKSEAIEVQAQGYSYPQAYTRRCLASGFSPESEQFYWKDFHVAESTDELRKVIDEQALAISRIKAVPPGVVEMWAGEAAPEGYMTCDGSAIAIAQYPELYAVIGTTFNAAPNCNGVVSAPGAGLFRLPDLRGRFVVGYNGDDNDYNALGKAGGSKKVALTVDEMPQHKHSVKDYYYIEKQPGGIDGSDSVPLTGGSAGTDNDNGQLWYKTHDTAALGKGLAHENRPPYYALKYIIKVK